MKTYGLATSETDYKTLKDFFGKIQIRVENGVDLLYVWNDFIQRRIFYSYNPALIAQQIREGKITSRTKETWPIEWR